MKTVEQSYAIKAPVKKVWRALTDPEIINQWGGGPNVIMDDRLDTKFSLWDSSIHGTNTKVVPLQLLEQDWYSDDWPQPSKVSFSLSESAGVTTIRLVHSDIPDHDAPDITEGWQEYYLGPLKKLLETH